MTEDRALFQWTGIAPGSFNLLQLAFAPTRTRVVGHAVFPKFPDVEASLADFVFLLKLNESAPKDVKVQVDIEYQGELLQIVGVDWLTLLDFIPTDPEQFREIHTGRGIVAGGDVRQRFFYDLDRLTHPKFMSFCPELKVPAALDHRIKLVNRLGDQLRCRMLHRIRPMPVAPIKLSDLEEVTRIFCDAGRPLASSEPPIVLSDALLQFAAGDLACPIPFSANRTTYYCKVSEPDSAAIFLFAELGLAGRAVAPEFWSLPMILAMVQMQRYFLDRFSGKHLLTAYHQPPRKLDRCVRMQIDDEYRRIAEAGLTEQRIESLIVDNLKRTAEPLP